MKNLILALLVTIISWTGIVHNANAQEYNSYIKKKYRGHFTNNAQAFKDEVLLGENAQEYLLIPVDLFRKQLVERITYYNSLDSYYDQIDQESLEEIIQGLEVRTPDPNVKMPMTTYKNGQSVAAPPRYPEVDKNEQTLGFKTWPDLISTLCANFTLWQIIPRIESSQMMAQNTPKQQGKLRWTPGGGSSSTASNSNVNNINITNNIPATATQPYVQQNTGGDGSGGKAFVGGLLGGAIGGFIGTKVGQPRQQPIFIPTNSGNRDYDRRDTYQRETYSRPRNDRDRNDRDHYDRGRSQGNSGGSQRPVRRTIPRGAGNNGNIHG